MHFSARRDVLITIASLVWCMSPVRKPPSSIHRLLYPTIIYTTAILPCGCCWKFSHLAPLLFCRVGQCWSRGRRHPGRADCHVQEACKGGMWNQVFWKCGEVRWRWGNALSVESALKVWECIGGVERGHWRWGSAFEYYAGTCSLSTFWWGPHYALTLWGPHYLMLWWGPHYARTLWGPHYLILWWGPHYAVTLWGASLLFLVAV